MRKAPFPKYKDYCVAIILAFCWIIIVNSSTVSPISSSCLISDFKLFFTYLILCSTGVSTSAKSAGERRSFKLERFYEIWKDRIIHPYIHVDIWSGDKVIYNKNV